MISLKKLQKSFLIALWFALLSFPLLVIKTDPINRTINWRWSNLALLLFSVFALSLFLQIIAEKRTILAIRE